MDESRPAGPIDNALEGTPRGRFLAELYSNSAVFPIAIVLLEILLEGAREYFLKPDFYAIALGATAQAAWLSRLRECDALKRAAGNLVAPAVYSTFEIALEGPAFFLAPHHVAYWGFALAVGLLQGARASRAGHVADALLVAEHVVRSMFLFAVYAIFEGLTAPVDRAPRPFFADASHLFIAWAIALLGLAAGIAAVGAQRYLVMLRQVSERLRLYSEWFFGRTLLEEAVADPARLALRRCERAILFMDLRAFTAWSESQSPEAVAEVLNGYYVEAEVAFARWVPIRFKFSADEVMAVFAEPNVALEAARALAAGVARRLEPHGLGAGIGLHWGAVVEGLMGGSGSKLFDVIGDPVNTAKRIEGAAGAGEVLVSSAFCAVAGLAPATWRWIEAKGKSERIAVHAACFAPAAAPASQGAQGAAT